ncbi:exostosin-2 [Chelonus insularis]|uniref:exostosin-2 n=1 Tax=Chelonus insularis TaxID=460826 RepID=UPI00158ACBB2|nr:exostosin-2 [Chelonus insularis]
MTVPIYFSRKYDNHGLYPNCRNILFFIIITVIFCIVLSVTYFVFCYRTTSNTIVYKPLNLEDISNIPDVILEDNLPGVVETNTSCTHFKCFNVYRCGVQGNKLLVYVYPLKNYIDASGKPVSGQLSKEFLQILQAIVNSKQYTPNPHKACIFVPSIDTLNQNKLNTKEVSRALASLEFWNGGENHIIFNMIPGSFPDYNTTLDVKLGKAIIAGAGFSTLTFRSGFDISLPVFSSISKLKVSHKKTHFLISAQININAAFEQDLTEISMTSPNDILILRPCLHHNPMSNAIRCFDGKIYKYPEVLRSSIFCLVIRGARLGQSILLESLAAGCIPVIVSDSSIMPFHDIIDWKSAAVFIREVDILTTIKTLKNISTTRVNELRNHGRWLWKQYFKSMEAITQTTLEILTDRIFPHLARNYNDWNIAPGSKNFPPLFLPVTAPKTHGFTAVVLTYDRVELLFSLVNKLTQVPSLSKILVIWNNVKKDPPASLRWPKINKPIQVIRTKENKLSNRFYPYDEIETEGVLSIDDDIIMLTADELEFAYEVWREFPDRIVGFPSRTHTWDNETNCWKYESEWTNRISMVLTGAAFHHKFWNYLYTTAMPGDIKMWVDQHMNCEDIAMNFLVANVTGKAPIKVTPKKKFRCPECTNTEMLSADLAHMAERTQCINRFTNIYKTMPLKSVEFRADPVLFKDVFPEKLKRFNAIRSL